MRRIFPGILFIIILFGGWRPAGAAANSQDGDGIQVDNVGISHIFGEQLQLQAQITSDESLKSLKVVIQAEDGTLIASNPVVLTPEGEVFYTFDILKRPIRTFSFLSIWFVAEIEGQPSFESEPIQYFYADNRFEWQSLSTDSFSVFWYDGSVFLGEEIQNAANEGVKLIHSLIDTPTPEDIEIYAYNSIIEMQDTLFFTGEAAAWIAGHADPDLKVIVVSLPEGPSQKLEIKRQIPHEILHVLLYEKVGPGYGNIPRWFNEGLASMAELFPNPDYQILLNKAHERGTLLPIASLCQSFPLDAASFQLSYAESYAFTLYFQQTYGNEAVEALIQAYADGQSCEQGFESTLGLTLNKIEADWRQAMFNENSTLNNLEAEIPLVTLLGVPFLPILVLSFINARKRRNKPTNE
jgi:hypothetical protein